MGVEHDDVGGVLCPHFAPWHRLKVGLGERSIADGTSYLMAKLPESTCRSACSAMLLDGSAPELPVGSGVMPEVRWTEDACRAVVETDLDHAW